MRPLKILITNIWLKGRSGTEIVTMEMAHGLVRRGHEIVVFSPEPGESAERLKRTGINVTDRLDEIEFIPEIIHGNHSVDLVHGLIAFPGVPGIFVCHNPSHWICSPPDISRVRTFVSVDRRGCERIAHDLPRARGSIRLVHNAVDLKLYQLRAPLPQRPTKALMLTKFSGCLPVVQAACRQTGLELEAIGPGVDVVVDDLPKRLERVDIVFATARMAIEAMAVGCAVVVVDDRGLAGLVTDDVVNDWRDDNFGKRLLTRAVTVDALVQEISSYDASVAARVTANVRSNNNLDHALSVYETIYTQAIDANDPVDPKIEAREMSRLMRCWLPTIGGVSPLSRSFFADEQLKPSSPLAILLEENQVISSLLRESDRDRAERLEQIEVLTALLKESEIDRAERLKQIHKLTALHAEAVAEHAAKSEQIQTLSSLLKHSELDRAEQLEQIHALTRLSSRPAG